jgi:hypothetical protein
MKSNGTASSIGRAISDGRALVQATSRNLHRAVSEKDMKHAVKNLKENMYGLLECLLADYARQLRIDYPKQTIRSAVVVTEGRWFRQQAGTSIEQFRRRT